MARLPVPGSDVGTWGTILNDFLAVAHTSSGGIKDNAIGAAQIQNDSITGAQLQDNTITPDKLNSVDTPANGEIASFNNGQFEWIAQGGTPDATTTTKGVIQLAGDLGGTGTVAAAPVITDGAITNAKVSGTANIAQSKIANLTTDLSNKQPLDSDLTTIASLTPVNDDILQRKAGTWTNRTPAQLKLDLGLTKSDVGLGNVDNTSDANKPISTATQTALDGKADDNAVVHLAGDETVAGIKTFSTSPVVPTPTNPTDAANKDYVDNVAGGGAPDATITTNGLIRLAGDLGGTGTTAAAPVITDGAITDVKVSGTANIAQSKISNLTTDLSGKQPLDSDLTAIASLTPTNDDILQRKAGAWTNRTPAQLKTDLSLTKTDVGLANVDNTSDANKPISTATQTALDGKVALAGANISTLADSTIQFLRVNIPDDGSPTSGWPDRYANYFNGTRTGYANEYGELRARPGKTSTVALRAMGHASGSSGDIFQVANSDASTVYMGVSSSQVTLNVAVASTQNITAPNIGVKVSTGTVAPSSPSVGDVWIDTN